MKQHNSIRLGQGFAAVLITWLLIGLILGGLFSGQAFAVTTSGDDFDDNFKDPANWGADEVDNKGVMTEINQRLEYTTTGLGTADHDSVDRPWRAARFPYNADWQIQIDVMNKTTSGEFTSFGIYVSSLDLEHTAIEVELAQSSMSGLSTYYFWAEFYSQNPIFGDWYASDASSTYGAVRIAFNSTTKVFTVYGNPDPGGNNPWTAFGSFGVAGSVGKDCDYPMSCGYTNWGLTNADLFGVAVFGYSMQANKIASGQLYGDNFLVMGGVGPDLIETSVSDPPKTVFRGANFKVTDTAKNAGAEGAKGSVTRYYLSSDAERSAKDILLTGSRAVPGLAPEAISESTVTVTVPGTTPFGIYYLLACADDTKLVPETDEINNCIAAQSTIEVSGPDLVETSVSASEPSVFRGAKFQVTDTAKNNGGQGAGASSTRYYLSSDAQKDAKDILLTGSRSVPALASGGSHINSNGVTVTVPGTVPFGNYYLFACADDAKVVTETNETNNCIAAQSTIEVAGPDLIETSVSALESPIFRGKTFKVTDTAQNNGPQGAGVSTTRYYLSSDAQKDAKDILLTGSRSVPALASGGSHINTNGVTMTVPGTAPFGTYYLLACADDTNLVAETNETNNCVASQSTIEVAGPDLTETSVGASESPVFRGKSFKVADTAKNNGGQAAGVSTTRYYLSPDTEKSAKDILLTGSRPVPALQSGASSINNNTVTVTVPATVPFGAYYLLACADDTKVVVETNETNNCVVSQSTIEVAGPDFIETSVSALQPSVFRGTKFQVLDTAQNIGGAHATRASVIRYYLSLNDTKGAGDILLTGSRALPALQSGATSTSPEVTVTVPGTTPFGTYYLLACADDTNLVPETNETNNCLATQSAVVEVTGPDLAETSVSVSESSVFRGKTLRVTDTAKNNGAQGAGASTTRYYLSADNNKGAGDILLTGSRAVPALPSGGSHINTNGVTVTVPGTAPFGTYYLLACADDTKLVAETDESNNCIASSSTIEVAGPDLVETSVSEPPKTAFRGDKFQVTDTAQNNGGQAAGVSTTRYYLSLDNTRDAGDTLLTGSRAVPALASNISSTNTVTVTIPVTAPFGNYYLLACADDTKLVVETSETNNCIASQSTIEVAGADLVETSVSASASSVSRGKSLKVTDTAENTGGQAAKASVTRYYLSLDNTKGTGDILLTGSRAVPALEPGATSASPEMTVTVPGTTPAGTYYLFACADDTKLVVETSETNNCIAAQSKIVVAGPDLIELYVEIYESYVFRGGTFQVTDTVKNDGTEAAGASTTRYYLSTNPESHAGDILLSGSRAVPSLQPGTTSSASLPVTVTVPKTTPFGTYFVFACADYAKAVAETVETNNCSASPWTIEVVGPDLIEESLSASKTTVLRGQSFQVTDMAQNIGFEASGASVTRYYLSFDYTKGPEDILLQGSRTVPALESNGISENTVTVTVPVTTAIGTYNIFACADDTGLVAETDELNNCFASGQVSGQIEVQ